MGGQFLCSFGFEPPSEELFDFGRFAAELVGKGAHVIAVLHQDRLRIVNLTGEHAVGDLSRYLFDVESEGFLKGIGEMLLDLERRAQPGGEEVDCFVVDHLCNICGIAAADTEQPANVFSLLARITAVKGAATLDDWTYTYNHRDWLMSATNGSSVAALDETFTYQPNGNLVSRTRLGADTFTYPAATEARPHAPIKLGAATIGYDANGNMLADGSRALTWDAANRLSKVTVGSAVTSFAYGPDDARAKKATAFATTLYPSADIEINATGGAAAISADDYTRYPHPDIKIVGAQKYFLHRDHLASVRFATTATGAVTDWAGYAAYGERLTTAGAPAHRAHATWSIASTCISDNFESGSVRTRRG